MRIFTVGHSTHPLDEFAALLDRHGIRAVADVRRAPYSRRHPQFNREPLAAALEERGVGYRHLEDLGGRRQRRPGSPNGGWEHPAFQGYADYALTEPFARALEELKQLDGPAAVMCAEALWWRCHRRLIADRLTAQGVTVCHIGSDGELTAHELPPFAVLEGDKVLYPPIQGSLLEP